ncbi:MAG: vitamin B12-dependent ribonucleotide reductase, partial [Oscillospiraceae bacterium]|nr:vitamin B12-dependent ribonucleotide reductase [Oscillospiraceae bacterium]
GSGTGTNFSKIRAEGERLSAGGVSSGLMSFLKALDRNAGAIKSGGTTRRAAKMVCLEENHPEILKFINWKSKEEEKVRALAKMGYDADMNGEAYETVSGQNSNNSVLFSNDFMKKIANLDNNPDATISLKGRVDSSFDREIKIKEIWDNFIKSAWSCADPAPLFKDTFNAWHTCPCGEDGNLFAPYNQINSTNPCGEYCFLDDTSCNLASINLYKFYDIQKKEFDIEGYLHIISLTQLTLEASIFQGQFPTTEIARKTYNFRATGLGVANLASLLLAFGYPYDSEEARALAQIIIGILTGQSYYISALMAAEVGTFEKYALNRDHMLKVIRNHIRVVNPKLLSESKELLENGVDINKFEGLEYAPYIPNRNIINSNNFNYLFSSLEKAWRNALIYGEKFGFRNAQVSVIAPSGTISFAMDSIATSIEPFFSHVVYKKLVGGGSMMISNPVIKDALLSLGYSEKQAIEITDYIENLKDGKIEGAPHLKEEHLPIFDTASKCGSGIRYIKPMGHVLMTAAIAPMISGAISKTVNLPKEADISDIENIVISSWKLGIKGLTVYRDSSKVAQPLNTSLTNEKNVDLENLSYEVLLNYAKLLKEDRQKSPVSQREKVVGIRNGRTHPAQIEDVKIYTTVNRRDNNEISEIYITTDREGSIITGLLNSLSKAISVMLQYHVPAKDISRMLRGQKYEPYGFVQKHPYIKYVTSISDLISKIIDIELGDYTRVQVKPEDDEKFIGLKSHPLHVKPDPSEMSEINSEKLYGAICATCSSSRMVKNGNCMVCLDCGSTTGCS